VSKLYIYKNILFYFICYLILDNLDVQMLRLYLCQNDFTMLSVSWRFMLHNKPLTEDTV